MDLIQAFENVLVAPGEIAVLWLGQAGFLIKDCKGKKAVIDPYLTDSVERLSGYKRLMMPIVSPDALDVDIYLCTHAHDDHLDVDAAPEIMKNPETILIGPSSVTSICRSLGIATERMVEVETSQACQIGDYIITAVYADHGDLEPCAMGFVVENGGVTLYFTGDTAYRPEQMAAAFKMHPDVVILPINGEFGNLNAEEAALVARDCGAKAAIPSHFWTLAVHRGDPFEFGEKMKELAPECRANYLCQGEFAIFHANLEGKRGELA